MQKELSTWINVIDKAIEYAYTHKDSSQEPINQILLNNLSFIRNNVLTDMKMANALSVELKAEFDNNKALSIDYSIDEISKFIEQFSQSNNLTNLNSIKFYELLNRLPTCL